MRKKAAIEIQEEWDNLLSCHSDALTKSWVSSRVLRPFLFFIRSLSVQHQKIQARDIHCMQTCFKILLKSINSNGMIVFSFRLNHWSGKLEQK